MDTAQIVIDTNVLLSGLCSRRGASFQVLSLIGSGKFEVNLSVPLVIEYEDVLHRFLNDIPHSWEEIDAVLNYICLESRRHKIFYLWRPYLSDAKDDMVLELAVAAGCEYIVTFNLRDFDGIDRFGIKAITPKDFLRRIGEMK